MGNIGNVYAQLIAVCRPGNRNRIVQVLGRSTINGKNRCLPQIQTVLVFFRRNRCFCQLLCLLQNCFRELRRNAPQCQHCLGANRSLLRIAKYMPHHGTVFCMPGSSGNQLCQHLIAFPIGYIRIFFQADGSLCHRIRQQHETAFLHQNRTGQLAVGRLQYIDYLAFRLSAAGGNIVQQHLRHGTAQKFSGNKNFFLVVGTPCKAKRPAQPCDAADKIMQGIT